MESGETRGRFAAWLGVAGLLIIGGLDAGCSKSTLPRVPAMSTPGRLGYGLQTHAIERFMLVTEVHGVSLAGDSPERGAMGEVVWRADAGGDRLVFCTSGPTGGDCREASAYEGLRGPLLIVDPINRGRSIQTGAGLQSRFTRVGAVAVTNETYPVPAFHGIWVTNSLGHALIHCRADPQGPICHPASFNERRVAPQPILALFLLGDAEIIWVNDRNNGGQILRCHVQPNQPIPVCLAARRR